MGMEGWCILTECTTRAILKTIRWRVREVCFTGRRDLPMLVIGSTINFMARGHFTMSILCLCIKDLISRISTYLGIAGSSTKVQISVFR